MINIFNSLRAALEKNSGWTGNGRSSLHMSSVPWVFMRTENSHTVHIYTHRQYVIVSSVRSLWCMNVFSSTPDWETHWRAAGLCQCQSVLWPSTTDRTWRATHAALLVLNNVLLSLLEMLSTFSSTHFCSCTAERGFEIQA